MDVVELSAGEYNGLFNSPAHVYNSVKFVELNRHKCDAGLVRRLSFYDGRAYAGIIFGEMECELLSPFSAPFGGFDINREPSAMRMIEIVRSLKLWLGDRRCAITLPPAFYNPGLIAKTAYALQIEGWQQETLINHHLPVVGADEYVASLDSKSRNKLKHGLACDHYFVKLDSDDSADIERAYRIIELNRSAKGYPLRMGLQEVADTAAVVEADFFVLAINGEDVASAQIYHAAPGIAQVIYWGDNGLHAECHPMNLLAYHILRYYSGSAVRIIDIGPSGDFESLNGGLADFKESIGCLPSLKFRFTVE